tara:strand:- start:2755 stop:3831 length:1077 start_codon:yes stop_codon:yes gene_type:complete
MVLRTLYGALFSFVIAGLFLILFTSSAFAQTGAGIGLRPAITENNAEPGTSQTHTIEVTNLSAAAQTYYLFMRDIVAVENGGTPVFADENAEITGFEMSEWVTLGVEEMYLESGESKTVEVTIDVPENATPGSHFAGMFVSMEPPRMRSIGAAVGYEVASIFSIRVNGDVVENAQIREFSTGNYIYGESKVDFRTRIENKGTVLVRPIGPLEVYNMFGKRVALLTFNDTKAGIFPGSEREFEIMWEDEGPGFGRYEAVLSALYGEKGRQSTISSSVSFWILPMNIFLPAIGVLALLLLVTYISIRLYIRSKVRGVTGASRRVVRQQRTGGGMSALLFVVIVMLAVTALFLLLLLILFA